jgi:hypothetical protein
VQKLGQANDYFSWGGKVPPSLSEAHDLKVDFRELARLKVQFFQAVTYPCAQMIFLIETDLRSVSAYDEHILGIHESS